MQTNETQTSHLRLLAIITALAVVAVIALLAQGDFGRIPVVLDGQRSSISAGDSVKEVMTARPALARPGDLLAATDGRVVRAGGGHPARVTLNGRPATLDARVAAGDAIEIEPGADAVEPTAEETRVVSTPAKIIGKGALLTMVTAGASGLQRVVIGTVSGDIVTSETVVPPEPMILRRMNGDGKKVVALTFDDGPWPIQTGKILDILKAEGVPATFFAVGLYVKQEPDAARRIVAEGHAIGSHTYRHVNLTTTKPDVMRREIRGANDMIRWTTGVQPKWFRPPMGQIDGPAYGQLKAAGLRPVLWTVDPQDWRDNAEAGQIARAVIAAARPGSVILLHDGGGDQTQTIKALPWIIHELRKKGYEFVLLGDLPNAPKARW
jgi:peptidoglycan/xylan/chitin deacetylase (PgdA/CDA1 family)